MTPIVLVTGGHGTMGPWVVRALHERGARVVVYDVLDRPRSSLREAVAEPDETVSGDVRDADLIAATLRDHAISHVVHLAAMVGEDCERDPVAAFDINTIATARLIGPPRRRACRAWSRTARRGCSARCPIATSTRRTTPCPSTTRPARV